jgi:REP element-mobilizing transposase RayT
VKYRGAIIHKEWRHTLLGEIGNLIKETGCKTIIANGVEDHVHCFVGLKPIISISELMKGVKAKSSKYINVPSLQLSIISTSCLIEWTEVHPYKMSRAYGSKFLDSFSVSSNKRCVFIKSESAIPKEMSEKFNFSCPN